MTIHHVISRLPDSIMKRKLQLPDTRTLLIIVRPMGVSGIDQAFSWTYMTYSRLSDHVVLCCTVVLYCHRVIFFSFACGCRFLGGFVLLILLLGCPGVGVCSISFYGLGGRWWGWHVTSGPFATYALPQRGWSHLDTLEIAAATVTGLLAFQQPVLSALPRTMSTYRK